MRVMKRNPWLAGLGMVIAALVVSGGPARADVTTDRPGSIIFFPKVISTPPGIAGVPARDTVIQISTRSNLRTTAHCFYVNAIGLCSTTVNQQCELDTDCPVTSLPGVIPAVHESCVRACSEQDFDIFLTAQQPTWWLVSRGRSLGDPIYTGFPPNATGIHALLPQGDFEGQLTCVETDPLTGDPWNGNDLRGIATVINSGSVNPDSTYSSVNVISTGLTTDNDLNFTGSCDPSTGVCTGEYNACPATLLLNHFADGATDPFLSDQCVVTATPTVPCSAASPAGSCSCTTSAAPCTAASGCPLVNVVNTELTLMPCTQNIPNYSGPPGPPFGTPVNLDLAIFNELEQKLTGKIIFDCWFNRRLSDITFSGTNLTLASLLTPFAATRISPVAGSACLTGARTGLPCTHSDPTDPTNGCPGSFSSADGTDLGCRPWSGVVGVAEEFHALNAGGVPVPGVAGADAYNLHIEGARSGDILVVP